MFTGIIQDIGDIAAVEKKGDWILTIKTEYLALDSMGIGASVSCHGVCLTMTEKNAKQFKVQVSRETLSTTNIVHWQKGTRVNLEPALKLGDAFGGHILSGHIDGLLRVVSRSTIGDSLHYEFEVPQEFARFIAPKGSIAIDGISLTVNEVQDVRFGVNIIPHTQQIAEIASRVIGDEVNFEVDIIARYVDRMMSQRVSL
jgi:riboflavin synthase